MRYGVHVGGAAALRTVDGVKQIGELAEEFGYDGIITGDHITIPKHIVSEYPYTKFSRALGADPYAVFTTSDWLDGFTVLALLIPVTKKVRLGTSVTIVPYRHPLEMARVVATLDVVSGGRVILGAGVGWMEEEFRLLGIPFKERAPRTREYIAVMKEVWTKETPRFNGKFVQIDKDLYFAPRPLQKPHPPIWVGGESTPALKRVVAFGDGWHIGPMALEEVKPRFAELRTLMEKAGRDFSKLEITAMVDSRLLSAADIRAYRDLGVSGLYAVAPGPEVQTVLKVLRDFPKKVQDAAA
ncbi:MAG TPA: TIGR03619 family F420-dependent LLM class oxidoreductase [Methylomirabilota bacterium]|jgi:probable F420-dependent oxidoreductase|nr:TIGR03619 family F420-dependent LLM class oxidoreductase [Methylomirabilota bacterium]